jgi:hypothetical protein
VNYRQNAHTWGQTGVSRFDKKVMSNKQGLAAMLRVRNIPASNLDSKEVILTFSTI